MSSESSTTLKTLAALSLVFALTLSEASQIKVAEGIINKNKNHQPLLTQELVDEVNNRWHAVHQSPDSSTISGGSNTANTARWRASVNNGRLITGATKQQVQKLLGARLDDQRQWASASKDVKIEDRVFTHTELSMSIPEEFDSATQWPNCSSVIRHIWDQSNCGSCWAVGAASAISDRTCIAGRGSGFLSARDLLTCCTACGDGCDGGYAVEAWAYWVKTGLVAESCQPYPFPKCGHTADSQYPPCSANDPYDTPECLEVCNGDDDSTRNKNKSHAFVSKGATSYRVKEEEDYQREIMLRGPIEATFMVFADFVSYKSGVYATNRKEYLGNHAVRIVGWGVLDGVKYWKVANSWNSDWGADGYILMQRGTNECSIERTGVAGLPA